MNWDQIQGNWRQFKGEARRRWGKLTDDDLAVIAGDKDKLLGKLQERYGRSRDELEHELNDFCAECEPVGVAHGSTSGPAAHTTPSRSRRRRQSS